MLKAIYSSSIAAIISIIFVVVITIWAELSPSLKDLLKSFSGHHWLSKNIWMVILYILSFLIVFSWRRPDQSSLKRSLIALVIVSILGFIAILSFFIWHA